MRKTIQSILASTLLLIFVSTAHADPVPVQGWNVDCGNYCSFNEFPNNCQGVYYLYPDSNKSYSSWSSNYQACQEFAPLNLNTHIIHTSQIQCGCPTPTQSPPTTTAALTPTTKAQLEVLRAQVQGWTVCTPDPTATYTDIFNSPLSPNTLNTCQYFRKRNMRNNFMSVGGCYKGLLGFVDGSWHPCNFPGDHLSNSVENCMFGDKERCNDIKDSQDPISGMWYRNPFLRRHPEASLGQSLFSRDALDGLLGYVITNNDKAALKKWLIFVRNNPKSPPANFFSICPPRPNIPKPAEVSQKDWDGMLPDDRCGLIPEAAGMVYKAAITVGLTNADLNAIGTDFYSAMASGSTTVFGSILGESSTAPALGPSSYQIGDTADAVFIAMLSGGANNSTLITAGNNINNRTSKLNPGYHFLAQNKTPTEYGAYLINKYCKPYRPNWGVYFTSGYAGHGNNTTEYWATGEPFIAGNYQYQGGWGPYSEKILPSGHDCLAWLNMYLGNGDYTELQCDSGDTLINGACEHYAFPKPYLAAVPGIDYKLRAGDAKIHYQAVDMNSCPYGGTLELGGWPNFARCSLPSGLTPAQINGSVTYTVDPTETWPGIFYPKVGGACPYGGTYAGANCEVKAYSLPVVPQTVAYWVDTNPSWPGVYYKQINGHCTVGGVPAGPNCLVQGFGTGFLSTSKSYFVRPNPAHPGVYYYPKVVPETRLPVVPIDRVSSERLIRSTN